MKNNTHAHTLDLCASLNRSRFFSILWTKVNCHDNNSEVRLEDDEEMNKNKSKKPNIFGYDLIFQTLTKWLVPFDHLDRCVCVCVCRFLDFIEFLFCFCARWMNACHFVRKKNQLWVSIFVILFSLAVFRSNYQAKKWFSLYGSAMATVMNFLFGVFCSLIKSLESDDLIINHMNMLKCKTSETNS